MNEVQFEFKPWIHHKQEWNQATGPRRQGMKWPAVPGDLQAAWCGSVSACERARGRTHKEAEARAYRCGVMYCDVEWEREIMPLASTWMDACRDYSFQVKLSQKDKTSVMSLIRELKKKKDTNEFIYKTEIESQTKNTNLWLPKGKGEGERDKLGVCG